MSKRSLTARSVKQLLTRAGVNWRYLVITEEKVTTRCWSEGDFGPWETYTQVRVAGPKAEYDSAYWALMAAGLSSAPYPGYSLWSRTLRRAS